MCSIMVVYRVNLYFWYYYSVLTSICDIVTRYEVYIYSWFTTEYTSICGIITVYRGCTYFSETVSLSWGIIPSLGWSRELWLPLFLFPLTCFEEPYETHPTGGVSRKWTLGFIETYLLVDDGHRFIEWKSR